VNNVAVMLAVFRWFRLGGYRHVLQGFDGVAVEQRAEA
jgi:hypothetical protein